MRRAAALLLLILAALPAQAQQGGSVLSDEDRRVVRAIVQSCGIMGFVRMHEVPPLAEGCRSWAQQRPRDPDAAAKAEAILTQARTILDISGTAHRQVKPDDRKRIAEAALRIRDIA